MSDECWSLLETINKGDSFHHPILPETVCVNMTNYQADKMHMALSTSPLAPY